MTTPHPLPKLADDEVSELDAEAAHRIDTYRRACEEHPYAFRVGDIWHTGAGDSWVDAGWLRQTAARHAEDDSGSLFGRATAYAVLLHLGEDEFRPAASDLIDEWLQSGGEDPEDIEDLLACFAGQHEAAAWSDKDVDEATYEEQVLALGSGSKHAASLLQTTMRDCLAELGAAASAADAWQEVEAVLRITARLEPAQLVELAGDATVDRVHELCRELAGPQLDELSEYARLLARAARLHRWDDVFDQLQAKPRYPDCVFGAELLRPSWRRAFLDMATFRDAGPPYKLMLDWPETVLIWSSYRPGHFATQLSAIALDASSRSRDARGFAASPDDALAAAVAWRRCRVAGA